MSESRSCMRRGQIAVDARAEAIHDTRSVPDSPVVAARSGDGADRNNTALLVAGFLWPVTSTTAAHRKSAGRSSGEMCA